MKRVLFMFFALLISIRPALAEGIMLHVTEPHQKHHSQHVDEVRVMDHALAMQHQLHHPHQMANTQHHDSSEMACCDSAFSLLHQCDGHCGEGHCVVISAAPMMAYLNSVQISPMLLSQAQPTSHDAITERPVPPELRPPLYPLLSV
ncbi:hypothetical protein QCB44_08905 [Thiomicrorhabdus sp. zzn3]|uniref:hypothetical protein n=1 Tax=Thiomicrorhabdus sp. zzn3 TaxID=3039775 RepID=UPI002436650E|nr:hypothetical protein [Thiomicrorhabdus sp. zzn3]MDG6778823.1 hypothetical protein [Thiomicrorhabdus sp. zzn3]